MRMNDLPKSDYRLIKQGARYRVERANREQPSALRLPSITQIRDRIFELGLDKFHSARNCAMTEDGFALLTAEELSDFVKLDARSTDLYYVSPRQQAIMGLLSFGWPAATAALLLMFFAGFSGPGVIAFFMVLILGGGTLRYSHELESLHSQPYDPAPAEDPPAGA